MLPSKNKGLHTQDREPALQAAWERALRFLTYRARSRWEVEQKLSKVGFSTDVIEATIKKLLAKGLLGDAAFAAEWVHYRLQTNPVGRRRLLLELSQHGIQPEMAREVVAGELTPAREIELARKLAAKYQARKGELLPGKKDQLARYLWQRGFDLDIIHAIIKESITLTAKK